MIPPTRGMQAIAAAMFGGKSIDDGSLFGFAAPGGTGGGVGSVGSGIPVLTELESGFVKRTSFPCRAVSFPHLNPLPQGEADALAPGEGGGRTKLTPLR